ncbi:MAG: sulfotransferase [Fidelibacterota bacterium]|nr:MAG: sulfotransferase [Candidatus Neomarinimicrobiota bacterium]
MYKRVIVIVGMPRSGTSWLSQILDSCPSVRFRLSPLFSYAFKNAVDENSTKEEYEAVFHGAYQATDEFMEQTLEREQGHYPRFADKVQNPEFLVIKMTRFHNLLVTMLDYFKSLKMVAIVRHPCGAINSWLATPKEFPADADPMSEWRSGTCRKTGPEEFWGFEDWKTVTRLHMQLNQRYPEQFTLVQYEDLVDAPVNVTKTLFTFLGLPYTSQTKVFLRESQSRHDENTHSTFKLPSVKDRWKTELHPQIQAEIVADIDNSDNSDLRHFLK